MNHKLSYEIKPCKSGGFILEVWKFWFGFFCRRKQELAFTNLEELTVWLQNNVADEVKAWGLDSA